ncbi:MAG: hypothetical protein LBK99_17930 [Opitutaceae bacterium]|nr:hypothetical protein [Opitutaceae bacterium]
MLAYHGCDRQIGEQILAGKEHLHPSQNAHDWLGHGIYFWENNPERALHWAQFIQSRSDLFQGRIRSPFVIGAIIDPGTCLDLMEATSLAAVRSAYAEMELAFEATETPLPVNQPSGNRDEDLVKRYLDCVVINYLHEIRKTTNLPPYDSVRGAFIEGRPLYPGAGIMEKTHIQICVRNPRQIRGYFRPQPESDE